VFVFVKILTAKRKDGSYSIVGSDNIRGSDVGMNLLGNIPGINNNSDFKLQLAIILLILTNNNSSMNRNINSVTTTVDTMRSITEVINGTMQSLRAAAEAPGNIRQLLRKKQQ